MAVSPIKQVIVHLHRCAPPDSSDGDLLKRFVHGNQGSAFEALVHRLGPMVWAVCRRTLPHQDAEDAFQAAFLVLLRKAATIAPPEKVSSWLYGVTHNIVRKARYRLHRRWAAEKQVSTLPEAAQEITDHHTDLLPLLDRELLDLPERYRLPILLCDLRGQSRREVARSLCLPEGTLSARLTRGRRLLATRLSRRGVTLSGAVLAGMLTPRLATAGVPLALLTQTMDMVTLASSASPQVLALTEGVLKMMLFARIKLVSACMILLATLGLGIGLLPLSSSQATSAPPVPSRQPTPQADPAREPRLLPLEGAVTSVIWSPTGDLLASISTRTLPSTDGELQLDVFVTVRIHDARTGKELHSLGELKNPGYSSIQFSPDGRVLATTHRFTIETGDRIDLWDTRTGLLRAQTRTTYARSRPLLVFSPDGKTFAVAYGGITTQPVMSGARIFNAQTGKELKTLAQPGSTATSLAFSPDGKLLAVGGYSNPEIRLWDVSTGKTIRTVTGVEGTAGVLTFSPDGKTLACGSSAGGVRLWDASTAKPRPMPEANPPACTHLAFSPDGRLLAAATPKLEDGKPTGRSEIRLWDCTSGKLLQTLPDTSASMAFSPDGRTLSVLIPGKGIRLIRVVPFLPTKEK